MINNICSELKEIRITKGITQKELSQKIGFTQSNISRIEKGKHNCRIDVLESYAIAMGYEIIIKKIK
jgi:transcriptional regulator with XRE-family HTH domain